jgi:hypothetical protein
MTYKRLLDEVDQSHSVRRRLYLQIEKHLGSSKRVVAFFTSFDWPAMLEDADADMFGRDASQLPHGEERAGPCSELAWGRSTASRTDCEYLSQL